jgi:hypothetical protein
MLLQSIAPDSMSCYAEVSSHRAPLALLEQEQGPICNFKKLNMELIVNAWGPKHNY